MKTTIFLLFAFTILDGNAQIISQFDWDSNPITTATVGPNATSSSTSSVSDAGGVGGTNGLNPSLSGTPKQDLNLTIPGSPTFDVAGIDFSIDYHREESDAEFFTRGSSLVIGAGNMFDVSYRVEDGMGGFITESSGNAYPIPNDDTYRRYRFYYLPATGEGFLTVDGVQVWTNDGPDNRDLYWVGSGNVVIGNRLDGSGNNDTHLDNMVVGSITNSALPITLLDFSVRPLTEKNAALIEWETASEIDNDYFEIEKSKDGSSWEKITQVKGAGTKSDLTSYEYIDQNPMVGSSYYRLKQIDFDGKLEVFEPVKLNFPVVMMELSEFKIYPNPADNQVTISLDYLSNREISIFNNSGKLMMTVVVTDLNKTFIELDITNFPAGLYIASDGESTVKFVKN